MEARARLPNFRPCTIGGNRARSGGNPVHDFVDYAYGAVSGGLVRMSGTAALYSQAELFVETNKEA